MNTPTGTALKRTPLYSCHQELGARFTEFGGWSMPVQYSGLVDEHLTVRNQVGLFDVSHMGEIFIRGPNALPFLQYLTSNDVSKLTPGRAQYSLLLNPQGGAVDDIIVYQLKDEEYLLCVNASNIEKDYHWLLTHSRRKTIIEDASPSYGQIAIQGPKAQNLLERIFPSQAFDLKSFPSFQVESVSTNTTTPKKGIVARTGYTGEDGFELFCAAADTPSFWKMLITEGAQFGVKPAGLGARDTLRLEAGFPLHGHELSDIISVLSSGLGWVVKFNKEDFIGRESLLKEKEQGSKIKLIGFEVCEPGIVRGEMKIFSPKGQEIGWATSGTKPPTVNRAIGLAFVETEYATLGTELLAEVRGRKLAIQVIKVPFYKRKEK